MVPNESGFNQQNCFRIMRAHSVTFAMRACHGKGWLSYTRLHICHHGDTICHPKSGYVRTKLHGTSTCGCNNNAMFPDRAILTFPTVDVCWLR